MCLLTASTHPCFELRTEAILTINWSTWSARRLRSSTTNIKILEIKVTSHNIACTIPCQSDNGNYEHVLEEVDHRTSKNTHISCVVIKHYISQI